MRRRKCRVVSVGGVSIGGDCPIAVQSMCNTKTADIDSTARQLCALKEAGCHIVRLAILDNEDADAVGVLKKRCKGLPLVADIHFDYRLALAVIRQGIDKVRINPGNIGGADNIRAVADAARAAQIPIRIGINGGSLEKESLYKFGGATPEALVYSAMQNIELFSQFGFDDLVISIKSSSVITTIEANVLFAKGNEYPMHLGVTEAGTTALGTVKSSVGIGALLSRGIGDTIRVSLTADPLLEVPAAFHILQALGLRRGGVEVISCPGCGRCRIDLIKIADEVNARAHTIAKECKVAVMGCAVNGPGEARDADIGIAGGVGEVLLFKKGEIICKIPEKDAAARLVQEIEKL